MTAIPASELSAIQTEVNSFLDQSCQIQRKSATRTAEGYQVDNYATIATVSCNVAQPSPQMLQNYDFLIGALEAWLVRFSASRDVKRDDQLIVGGVTMRVHVVLTPNSYNVSTRVLAAALV